MKKIRIFQLSILGLIMSQIYASMEQIIKQYQNIYPVITSKIHHRISFFPVITMPEGIFLLLNLLIIVTLFVSGAFIFLEMKWTRLVILILTVMEIIMAAFPILASLYFKKYFAGTVPSFLILLFAILILFSISAYRPEEVNLEE